MTIKTMNDLSSNTGWLATWRRHAPLAAVVRFLKRSAAKQFFISGMERFHSRRFQGAVRAYSWSLALNPDQPMVLLHRASAFRHLGQDKREMDDINQAISLDPRSKSALLNRGSIHNYNRRFHDAILDLNRVLEMDPNNAEAFAEFSIAHSNLGDLDQAMDFANRAIAADSSLVKGYASRAWVYWLLQQPEKMLVDSEVAVAVHPAHPCGYVVRGLARSRLHQHQQSLDEFDQAIRLAPNDLDAIVFRAMAKAELGQSSAAIADCDEVLRRDLHYAYAYRLRGSVQRMLKNLDKSLADYDESHRLDQSAVVVAERALLYMELGQRELRSRKGLPAIDWFEKAQAELERAIELDPKEWTAPNGLAWFLATCPLPGFRNGAKAVELATTACGLSGRTNVYSLNTLAAAYAECRDFEQAIRTQTEAIELQRSQTDDPAQLERYAARLQHFQQRKTIAESES